MKAKNFLIFLLIILIIAFFITNFPSIYTIDDYAYAIAIGLDKTDHSGLILSLQIAIPSGSSKSKDSSSSSQSSSSIVSTVKCKNIDDGINSINDYLGQKLNLSYCKVIVFSEEIAKAGIGNYICTATNNIEIRPSCNIIISKCSALDYITNSKPLLENLSSKYYEIASSSEKDTGYTKTVSLMSFYNKYYDTLSEPFAPLSTIEQSESSNEQQKSGNNNQSPNMMQEENSENSQSLGILQEQNVEKDNSNPKIINQGLAIFKDDKLIGEITKDETLCYMLVSGKIKDAVLSIPSPFEDSDYISLSISSVNSKNKVEINGDSPNITCNISLLARVLSSTKSSNYLSKENSLAIEYMANSYLSANISDFLYKTSKELKSDFIGVGRDAVRSFKTIDDWNNYDWLNKYQNANFNVNVNTNVKSSYLLIG